MRPMASKRLRLAMMIQWRPTRVLYIVTTLAEFDNGHRSTIKGRDRFRELMVPCIVDSIESMISHPYDFEVDLSL
jgi:hypothetical protein